jgi:prevent-host-death family protein
MERLSMTKFRASPGEYMLDVIRDGKSYMLTKAGKDVARLLPASEDTVIDGRGRRIAGPELPLAARKG